MLFFIAFLIVSLVLAQGALVWLIAYMLAPGGADFSLWRGIVLGVVVRVWCGLSRWVLEPRISDDWLMLTQFLGTLLLVWIGFRLGFWRTLFVVVIFGTIELMGAYFLVAENGSAWLIGN